MPGGNFSGSPFKARSLSIMLPMFSVALPRKRRGVVAAGNYAEHLPTLKEKLGSTSHPGFTGGGGGGAVAKREQIVPSCDLAHPPKLYQNSSTSVLRLRQYRIQTEARLCRLKKLGELCPKHPIRMERRRYMSGKGATYFRMVCASCSPGVMFVCCKG